MAKIAFFKFLTNIIFERVEQIQIFFNGYAFKNFFGTLQWKSCLKTLNQSNDTCEICRAQNAPKLTKLTRVLHPGNL